MSETSNIDQDLELKRKFVNTSKFTLAIFNPEYFFSQQVSHVLNVKNMLTVFKNIKELQGMIDKLNAETGDCIVIDRG